MHNKNVSLAMMKRLKENPHSFVGKSKKGYFFSKKNNKNLFYRSSYELKAFEILEKDNTVLSFEYEPFKIEYRFNNKLKNYLVDILVNYKDGSSELIEVKPNWQLNELSVIAKKEALASFAKTNNYKWSIWCEEELDIDL